MRLLPTHYDEVKLFTVYEEEFVALQIAKFALISLAPQQSLYFPVLTLPQLLYPASAPRLAVLKLP